MTWKNNKRRIAFELVILSHFKVFIPAEYKDEYIVVEGREYSPRTIKRYAEDVIFYCEQNNIYDKCPVKRKYIPDRKAGKHVVFMIDQDRAVEFAKKLYPRVFDELREMATTKELLAKQEITTIPRPEDASEEQDGSEDIATVRKEYVILKREIEKKINAIMKKLEEIEETVKVVVKTPEEIARMRSELAEAVIRIEEKISKAERDVKAEVKTETVKATAKKCPQEHTSMEDKRLAGIVKELVKKKPKEYRECIKMLVKGGEIPDWCKLVLVVIDNATEDTGQGDTVNYYIDVYNRLDSVEETVEKIKRELKKIAGKK